MLFCNPYITLPYAFTLLYFSDIGLNFLLDCFLNLSASFTQNKE
ncbi:Hypothetical protein BN2458_PEG0079 [Helicobacter typhlonius]|uniref:Uncharacterized protein n=1 Tax=Helicobacter typhlonius TaxID=76936 RepID=A0A0S4PT93_9HELI|nr:Hypothetical protein BN2458_PEG0079 [Helicobacter typhlonius]